MDYLEILKKAFNITWKNKYLWILGFLVALVGGGNNFNSSFSNQSSSQEWAGAGKWLESYLIVILFIVLILFVLWFIFWILSIMAQGGLVGAANGIESGEEMGLGKAFAIGAHYFWRTLGISILLGLVIFIMVMVFVVPMVVGIIMIAVQGKQAAAALVASLICLIPAFLLLVFLLMIVGAVIGVIHNYAIRYAIILDKKVIESIKEAWGLIKDCKTETLIMFLLLLLTSSLYGMAMVIPGLIFGLPSIFMIIAGAAGKSVPLLAFGAFGIMVLVFVLAVFKGVYEVFHSSAWTLTFRELQPPDNI